MTDQYPEKQDYIKNFNKIVKKNITKEEYVVATTSGSTGEPFLHYIDVKKENINTLDFVRLAKVNKYLLNITTPITFIKSTSLSHFL